MNRNIDNDVQLNMFDNKEKGYFDILFHLGENG